MAPPSVHKFRTVDAIYKLGSYPVPPGGRTVPTMDRITTQEFMDAIVYEPDLSQNSDHGSKLGYALDAIFDKFAADIPAAKSLLVSRQSIQKYDPTIHANTDDDMVPLYDSKEKRWNWPMPSPNNVTLQQATQAAVDADSTGGWGETLVAAFFNTVAGAMVSAVKAAWTNRKVPAPHQHWLGSYSTRRLPGNADGAGAYDRHPDVILVESAGYSPQSLSWTDPIVIAEYTTEKWTAHSRLAKTLHTKAYLAFLDQSWRRFVLCLSLCRSELRAHLYDRSGLCISKPFDIHQNPQPFLAILAGVMFGARLCVGFDPTIIINPNRYPHHFTYQQVVKKAKDAIRIPSTIVEDEEEGDVSVALPDGVDNTSNVGVLPCETTGTLHSTPPGDPGDHTTIPIRPINPASNTDPPVRRLGWIRVNRNIYEILEIIFSSPGFLGRGTIIYLACRDGQLYIIKDHWVEDPDNEVTMMEFVRGIPGVPIVMEQWKVEILEGIIDRTSRYRDERERGKMKGDRVHVRTVISPCGQALTQFRTKRELLLCIRDVLRIQDAANARGILHRDTSPSNVLFEDHRNGVRGMLIDWEFAVQKTFTQLYSVGGTGTIPFLSRSLLKQIADKLEEARQDNKAGMLKRKIQVAHKPHDDVESFISKPQSTAGAAGAAVKCCTALHSQSVLLMLFYVLFWVTVLYNGPGGQEREGFDFNTSLLAQWSESAIQNLTVAKDSKHALLTERNFEFRRHVSPYFHDIIDLLEEWRQVFRTAEYEGFDVQIKKCIDIFDDYLKNLPPEDDKYTRKKATKKLKNSVPVTLKLAVVNQSKKRRRDIRSAGDELLQVKRLKAGV